MQFDFEVGLLERHRVSYAYDRTRRNLEIKVDGVAVRKGLRIMSLNLIRRYHFVVGERERHRVVIEKDRDLPLLSFRPRTYRAWVDGLLVAEHTG